MPLPELARHLVPVALAAVDPERLVREELERRRERGERFGAAFALGKAAAGMARGARDAGSLPGGTPRLLVRPHSSPALLDPAWEAWSGGHPLPDRRSVEAGARLAGWLGGLPGPPLLALISGGGSACLELPAPGLKLEDLAATQRALLASGRPIGAVNAVRKHLSALKGGSALRAASPEAPRILALLLSDVPGDDPATIASGPFVPDPTTFAEALAAVEGLEIPPRAREHLAAGARGERQETPKPGGPEAGRVEAVVLGGAGTAVGAVAAELRRQGFQVVAGGLSGAAAEAGRELVRRGRELPGAEAVAVVLGGETTVRLGASPGRGGRNQELALAAARELARGDREPAGEAVLTLATDGEDGPTRAAGALVDGATWERLRQAGVDPEAALARHDSNTALGALPGTLVETGPTGTNVGDLAIYLRLAAVAARNSTWDTMFHSRHDKEDQ
jgi:glycerate 2-kinase